jgi:leucyl/phenylalanyl-tRNA--protein transferase
MKRAYIRLHRLGVAHSVEAWSEGRLGGGIYGVALERAFFGESMFTTIANGSKVALVSLARLLAENGFFVFDCQQTTAHLLRFNAFEVPRRNFLQRLQQALRPGPVDSAMWAPRMLSWSPDGEAG